MSDTAFQPGSLVQARGREWVVLPETGEEILHLRPLGGSEDDKAVIYLPLEADQPKSATFPPPDPTKAGGRIATMLLRDAMRLKLRAGAGPFRSFGNLSVEPRAYQLVPLLMALKLDVVRLLIADDVGVGKTIEAGLIAREMLDRGEIAHMAVICAPHLCDQWRDELASKFNIQAEVVRTGTASRLERGLPAGTSIFDAYSFTVVSLDYIKSDRRRDDFLHRCPEFVIVEEAHSCIQGSGTSRHQRYQLLKGLAEDADRHMVMLTATPHSGDEEAFYNLLGLLDPRYHALRDATGEQRENLRRDLASHFVQRRRPDIAEWKDATIFPDRETREETYTLTGDWGRLFEEVLDYARGIVSRAMGLGALRERMSWWTALALLRCVSSSPEAAVSALRNRLEKAEGLSEQEQLEDLEQQAAETVLDGEAEDILTFDEAEPAGRLDEPDETDEDAVLLNGLIERAMTLHGPNRDPKIATLIDQLKDLLKDEFTPVIFCRYIATAHYVAEHLADAFGKAGYEVVAVTGELTPEEREERIEALGEHDKRILVATDCLSEGINLQRLFDAVVHYDLTWNPTRHEQREGRVDRFGQPKTVVRALMLYGENNPVDGAVLKVILRKAEKIRKELGVSVPMPEDSNKIMQALMEAVLLTAGPQQQLELALDHVDAPLEREWQSAKERAKQSQTIFAQRRLRPDDVLPEWRKAVSVLGGEGAVERFLRRACGRLGAPVDSSRRVPVIPLQELPLPMRERLEAAGVDAARPLPISFAHPASAGAEHIHRAHPLVATFADQIVERALAEDDPNIAARAGAIFTEAVDRRIVLYLLRLRSQITVQRWNREDVLLAEECVTIAQSGDGVELLEEEDARRLVEAESARNMDPAQRERLVASVIERLPAIGELFGAVATSRADDLLADHRRVREASEARGVRYRVQANTPVDVIGVYVLMPVAKL